MGVHAAPGPPKGLLSGVDPLVMEEGWALTEGAATLRAHEGLLTCVDSPVAEQHCAFGKGLAAVPATEGPFASMQQLMLCEVGAMAEGTTTLWA